MVERVDSDDNRDAFNSSEREVSQRESSRVATTTPVAPEAPTPGSARSDSSMDAIRSVPIRDVAYADADYVLKWLRQSGAPENIVKLQERATAYLGVASGR